MKMNIKEESNSLTFQENGSYHNVREYKTSNLENKF